MTPRTASRLVAFAALVFASPLRAAPIDPAEADTAEVCGCPSYVPIAVVSPPGGFRAGCGQTYVLKASGGNPVRDTWTLVDASNVSGGPCEEVKGGNWLRCALVHGLLILPAFVQAIPGNRSAIIGALEERFSTDTDLRSGICHADYTGNGARVLRLLVVRPFESSGRGTTQVVGVVRFFMQDLPPHHEDLVGEFLSFTTD
jgi:hypothetical protein